MHRDVVRVSCRFLTQDKNQALLPWAPAPPAPSTLELRFLPGVNWLQGPIPRALFSKVSPKAVLLWNPKFSKAVQPPANCSSSQENHQIPSFPSRPAGGFGGCRFWYELLHPEAGSAQPQNNSTSAKFPPECPFWTLPALTLLFLCPGGAELRQPLVVQTPPFP